MSAPVESAQYASHDFRDVPAEYGITSSMSRKGNCWVNACSEALFGSARCSSSRTGLPINPSKPTHELGYGVRIPGARSQTGAHCNSEPTQGVVSTLERGSALLGLIDW